MGVGQRSTLKKLKGAARHWLGEDKPPAKPITVDDDLAASARAFGATEEEIEAERKKEAQAAPEQDEFEVYEDCWESVMFFLRVQTQWVHKGMDERRAGLNNTAVESTMRMTGVKRAAQAELLEDLQVMERAVLEADAERAAKAGG